jgi:hypothetical protein
MESASRARKSIAAFVIGGLFAAATQARVLEIDVERATLPLGRFDGLALKLDWPDGAARGKLDLRAAALDAPELCYTFR